MIFDVLIYTMNLKNINLIKSVAFFVVIGLLSACKSVTMKKADDAMLIKQYAIAADMYDQLASNSSLTKEERQNAAFRGAECYRFNHQPKKALKRPGTQPRRLLARTSNP